MPDAILLLRVAGCEDGTLVGVDPVRAGNLASAGLLTSASSEARPWCLTEAGAVWLADFASSAHSDARRLATFLAEYRRARMAAFS